MSEPAASEIEPAADGGGNEEERRILRWRFRQFRGLGLSQIEARLAAESGVELALLRRLVADGCPPSLALRIGL